MNNILKLYKQIKSRTLRNPYVVVGQEIIGIYVSLLKDYYKMIYFVQMTHADTKEENGGPMFSFDGD